MNNCETKYKTLEFSGSQSKMNTNGFIPVKLRDSKATNTSNKNFFVFGRTSKQSDFHKNPMKVSRVMNPNKRSIDEFLEENPFEKETRFVQSNLNFGNAISTGVGRQRPHSSLITKKKVWIERKDKKKFEKPPVSKSITVNEKNK
jgi:hypothetical protein